MKAIHMGRERRQRLVSMVRYVAGLGLALGLLMNHHCLILVSLKP